MTESEYVVRHLKNNHEQPGECVQTIKRNWRHSFAVSSALERRIESASDEDCVCIY